MGTSRWTMLALGFMTAISVFALLAMLFAVDPVYADSGTLGAFYLTVFVAGSGSAAWVLMAARARLGKVKRPLNLFLSDALRQGLLVGGILMLSLLLQAGRHLNFLWVLLIVAFAFGIEAYVTRRVGA